MLTLALISQLACVQISNMMVMFIRILVSCELQRRQDFFAPFIMVGIAPSPCIQPEGDCC